MESVIIHCLCGEEYQTTIVSYDIPTNPPKTTEQATSKCPKCGHNYYNVITHQPIELRHIHMKPQEGGLIDAETARAVGVVR